MKLKRASAFIVSIIMLISVTGCGNNTESNAKTELNAKEEVSIDFDMHSTGSVLQFGTFEGEPINWIVLNKQFDKALLMTEEPLTSKPFHSETSRATWENSTIRTWLNDDFYNSAFSEAEKNLIRETQNTSIINSHRFMSNNQEKTISTTEKVFLLSEDEVSSYQTYMKETAFCWIRDTSTFDGCIIDYSTLFKVYDKDVEESHGICPAIWVDVKK